MSTVKNLKGRNPVKDKNDRQKDKSKIHDEKDLTDKNKTVGLKAKEHKTQTKSNGRPTRHGINNAFTKVPAKGEQVFHGENMLSIPTTTKISMVKNGISKSDLTEIKETCDLDYDTLSDILSVSRAKLINKKSNEKFDKNTSERIMHLRDVVEYGQSVFEDKDAFNKWLKKINIALGGKTPLELMDTIYGIEEVKKEIGRIEYGIF